MDKTKNYIQISADSICDLTPEYAKEHHIPLMPLAINMGETTVFDGEGVPDQIYAFADKTHQTPKTAARSPEEYREFFTEHKPAGGTLIHFTISAELSASYQNALLASQDMPDVYVVDPRSLSSGVGLLVIYAVELAENGTPADEILKKLSARIPMIQCSFLTKGLTYLHRGGRCSGASRFLATTMAIRPQIVMQNGKMIPGKKYMGIYTLCLKKYVNDILSTYDNPELDYCFITHTRMDDPKTVDEIKKQVAARYKFAHIYDVVASGTITSHCGPNTLGVLYANKKPN